ncbi:MAG: MarR family transcriptional regulator [Chloroflexi bacterium]|nr:MAG: MarR family transcriptional regulator [Chloroflexota bacterium]TMF15554.1 MAG: MarR family transcriptional regulator [Chloroflexota bacterium]
MAVTTSFYQDESLGEIQLAAVFRRGFRQALVLINRALAQHDLSPLQYHLLLEVGSAGEDGLVQGDLVELLQTPEARVSLLVHELGERGLVDTVRTAPDRRVVRVGITAEGSRLVRAALEAQRAALREVAREFAMPGVGEMLRNAMQLYLGVDISVEGLG